MNDRQKKIAGLCDGIRKSSEIALILGDTAKYVQRTMKKFDLPRLAQGAQSGDKNPAWVSGRIIDNDGYATVPCPDGHTSRKSGRISEHRLVMEVKLGRALLPIEIVDHIDGLHLHNHPSNLRLFASNAEHLRATITGQVPKWSPEGLERMKTPRHLLKGLEPVDTYRQRKASGDVRLSEILQAVLKLGIDSPFLLGTSRHLKKAGIVDLSHSSLERELRNLSRKYA